jgi:hypothetical protein
MERLDLGTMTDSLNVVTFGRNDERCVVGWMLVRTETRWAVVFAASFQGCLIKRRDFRMALGAEGDVHGCRNCARGRKEHARASVRAEPCAVRSVCKDGDSERRQRTLEEAAAGLKVHHSEVNVVQHESPVGTVVG